ncbi:hypothetical protein BpHYR1_001497 [Brachionus plicatilis]|uniref:Uncharacterized protein n=1 Tax=Brachionus plicatilis TaxID=10195 RepID=A0A3M7QDD4_BRAPC|nr:hypothetical protein BpHYR1_001497 [Brachionus plicatilis]
MGLLHILLIDISLIETSLGQSVVNALSPYSRVHSTIKANILKRKKVLCQDLCKFKALGAFFSKPFCGVDLMFEFTNSFKKPVLSATQDPEITFLTKQARSVKNGETCLFEKKMDNFLIKNKHADIFRIKS